MKEARSMIIAHFVIYSMHTSEIFKELVIIELASVLAGPAVGMFFSELGAKVIKVENKKTGGDVTRTWKLPEEDPNDEYSSYYHSVNWGKEKIMMDLTDPSDYSRLIELVKNADIVISNFKADSSKKLRLDYDTLKSHNPRLIHAIITAYGDDNPKPGFDAMIQAETGWVYMNGEKGGDPIKLPVAIVDILAGHQLKQGILIALLKRQSTGLGCRVSTSLFDASIAALTNQASNWLNTGIIPERKGSQHANIAPYGDIFSTRDNIDIILGTGTQKQFEGLCDCLNLAFVKSDGRFVNNTDRLQNRTELNTYLEQAIASLNYTDLKSRCDTKKVTIAPVNNMSAVFDIPEAQDLLLSEKQLNGGLTKVVKTAVFKIKK